MNTHVYAEYYFVKQSGILLYSTTNIYESKSGNPNIWINHTFVRQLDDITDYTVEPAEEEPKDFFVLLGEYMVDNSVPITIICAIIVVSGVSIREIHRHNVSRAYQEFKEILREEKGLFKNATPKKIKDESKK